ncbi:hypothetical protein UMM65_05160 [Aureibaculum sp. 2210JD6-5]|uniref:hypothetical protein n=1 Tax=Aureibaculum sp. 2210JD6-5 TaxID=3103957 RepID=UPI002AAD1E66|nr:hypothetical protein [Aureibaculum sp. 2210JD6-5]MDY7394620.1 hypothetical protein [Aureibaculum sp. 2210JD6-5]
MLKNILSIILLVVFANFIIAPTVISLVDDATDISLVFNLNEEENKEKESEKDKEIKLFQIENLNHSFRDFSGKLYELYKANYSKHYLKLHLPPPEFS